MSPPGIYVRGATTALTRRTTMRKAFLAPWDPMVEHLTLWFLAKAQAQTGTAIHASHWVINHHHTDVTPSYDGGLADFTRVLHGELSAALNTLLADRRYDAPGELFDDRPTHRMRLLDAEAQAGHHIYGCLQGVAAGLVARPEDTPCVALNYRHWKRGPVTIERPPLYVDPRTNPTELPLTVDAMPELYRAFDGDLDALLHHMKRMEDHGCRSLRAARRGRPVAGAKAVRRLHPWSEPSTLRETRGKPQRTFKAGARGIVGVRREVGAAAETTRFRGDHRDARVARRAGDLERAYPYGTYAARVFQGAPVQPEPPPDAILAKPGATLEQVREQLAADRDTAERDPARRAERVDARRLLVDEVKGAFEDEAQSIVEHDDIDLRRRSTAVPAAVPGADLGADSSAEASSPAGVEVRHRFSARSKARSKAARIVTLRDRRRGRLRREDGADGEHGSDPPG